MPPFQRQGHGATLIQAFYNECYARSDVLDVTGRTRFMYMQSHYCNFERFFKYGISTLIILLLVIKVTNCLLGPRGRYSPTAHLIHEIGKSSLHS